MANFEKTVDGTKIILRSVGDLDGSFDLMAVVGAVTPPEIHVYCGSISRINSVAVKSWVAGFTQLKARGARLLFFECAPVVISQMNMLSNFICGGTVMSVQAPYLCGPCRHEFVITYSAEQMKKDLATMETAKCPKCQGTAEFDDIIEDFARFLER